MRVVGGRFRNRRINPPNSMEARPTTDYAKEGLFNVLQHSSALEDIRVLDLFAGTGSISLEFLSRGAADVLSVEQDRVLHAFLQRTAKELQLEKQWRALKADVFTFIKGHRGLYDIVFADPPYDFSGWNELLASVRADLVIAESGRSANFGTPIGRWFENAPDFSIDRIGCRSNASCA